METKVGDLISWRTVNGPVTAPATEIDPDGYWVDLGNGKTVFVHQKSCIK